MKFKANIIALGLLLGLAAFRPWRTVNQAVGIPSRIDSVALAGASADTMLVAQPIQVLLPQSTIDTLVAQVNDKDSTKAALKAKNRKLDREIASLQKANAEKQSTLVSEKEIEALVAKQNSRHGPAKDPEPDEPKK